jgi:hypothetical protein
MATKAFTIKRSEYVLGLLLARLPSGRFGILSSNVTNMTSKLVCVASGLVWLPDTTDAATLRLCLFVRFSMAHNGL